MTDVDLTIRGRVESLELKPGDFVIITLDSSEQMSEGERQSLMGQLEFFFPHQRVVVLGGCRITKATG